MTDPNLRPSCRSRGATGHLGPLLGPLTLHPKKSPKQLRKRNNRGKTTTTRKREKGQPQNKNTIIIILINFQEESTCPFVWTSAPALRRCRTAAPGWWWSRGWWVRPRTPGRSPGTPLRRLAEQPNRRPTRSSRFDRIRVPTFLFCLF